MSGSAQESGPNCRDPLCLEIDPLIKSKGYMRPSYVRFHASVLTVLQLVDPLRKQRSFLSKVYSSG